MIYLASPYSHGDILIRKTRFLLAREVVVKRALEGFLYFSPIVYWHDMAVIEKLPTDAAYWRKFNMMMLRKCDALHVLKINGWMESVGVKEEMEMAEALHIPIAFEEPVS